MTFVNEEGLRSYIYDSNHRKYSELKREHISYLEREALFLKHPKQMILGDKLNLIKMVFMLTEELDTLKKEIKEINKKD